MSFYPEGAFGNSEPGQTFHFSNNSNQLIHQSETSPSPYMGQWFPLASTCHITTIWQVCRALLLALICTNLSLLLNLKNLFNFSFFIYSLKLTPEGNLNIPLHNEIALSFSLELRCHYQPSVPGPALYFFHQRNNSRHETPHWSNNHLKLLEPAIWGWAQIAGEIAIEVFQVIWCHFMQQLRRIPIGSFSPFLVSTSSTITLLPVLLKCNIWYTGQKASEESSGQSPSLRTKDTVLILSHLHGILWILN